MTKERENQKKSPYKTGGKIDRTEERDKESNTNENNNNKKPEKKHSKNDDK